MTRTIEIKTYTLPKMETVGELEAYLAKVETGEIQPDTSTVTALTTLEESK